jgi:hypothetical protein
LISFGLICRTDVLGHFRASGPAPKPAECFVGGNGRSECSFEARVGEPTKQNGAQRRARGFKRSCAQDNGGDREVGWRSTDKSQPARWNGRYPRPNSADESRIEGTGYRENRSRGTPPAAARAYRSSDGQRPDTYCRRVTGRLRGGLDCGLP